MFSLSTFWDRAFLFLTIISQGPSFLRPGTYRTMHLRHHQYSDTSNDPHSPVVSKSIAHMMSKTYKEYMFAINAKETFPKTVDFADSYLSRTLFVLLYIALYLLFTNSLWFLLLVPIHTLMGPIHGAIVNWFGHKVGYRNYDLADNSRNTLPIDFLMMGELYQNNHHKQAKNINFATKLKWYELDLTYVGVVILNKLKVVKYEK